MADRRRAVPGAAALTAGLLLAVLAAGAASAPSPAGLLQLGGLEHALVVEKASEKLFLYEANGGSPRLVRDFHATTGQAGGAKLREGDLKTPEGIYTIVRVIEDRDLPAEYGIRAFVLDYPNFFDRLDGKTGSGIWLHATDEPLKALSAQTTRGCVVVTNRDIQELTSYIRPGVTPVLVSNSLEWLADEERRRRTGEILDFMERWRRAWESWDLEGYFSCYSEHYRPGGGHVAWRAHKRRVARSAGSTQLELSGTQVLSHGRKAVISFIQHYRSTVHEAYGRKTLYLVRDGPGEYRIAGEVFDPLRPSRSLASARPPPPPPTPVPSPPPSAWRRASAPLAIDELGVTRDGDLLRVRFRLERTLRDGRASSGRLVIVASGADGSAWAFPGVTLVGQRPARPGEGDWYSIRRFKRLDARLGPLPPGTRLDRLAIYVFNRDAALVLERVAPQVE